MEQRNKRHGTENYRTLLRGVCWFASVIVISMMLTACGGEGEDSTPPLTSDASIQGTIRIANNVPLASIPGVSNDIFVRIVDPGDDIGGIDLPDPETMNENGDFIIGNLLADPLAYLNVHFTVDANLDNNGSEWSPVNLNIPVSLAKGIITLLSMDISRPEFNVIEISYNYNGPNGSREIHFRLNFATDLITFDLDADGRYDDLIAVDTNHDSIPDEHAGVIESMKFGATNEKIGVVSGIGSNLVSISGTIFEVWGSTNITNSVTLDTLTLAEISNGSDVTITYVPLGDHNLAIGIEVQPSPENPYGEFSTVRNGIIEEIDQDGVFVSGTLFGEYRNADIEDAFGKEVSPDDLTVGDNVSITGVRLEEMIMASEITVSEILPETVYVERQGTIEALIPEDEPSVMTVDGIDFNLLPQTVIEDLSGEIRDRSDLVTGNPVRVYGIESDGLFYANLIELQYTIDDRDYNPEVVVLYDNIDKLPFVLEAIGQLSTGIPVAPVLMANYDQADPPCVQDSFNNVALGSNAGSIMASLSGFRGAYPRVVDGECVVLVLIKDTHPETEALLDLFFPFGIGTYGTPLMYDLYKREPFYGAGENFIEAASVKHELESSILWDENVIEIYISSDINFTGN